MEMPCGVTCEVRLHLTDESFQLRCWTYQGNILEEIRNPKIESGRESEGGGGGKHIKCGAILHRFLVLFGCLSKTCTGLSR